VLNCPCCFRNLTVLRAMADSTLLPSAIGIDPRGDGAPAGGAIRQRKGGANYPRIYSPRLAARLPPTAARRPVTLIAPRSSRHRATVLAPSRLRPPPDGPTAALAGCRRGGRPARDRSAEAMVSGAPLRAGLLNRQSPPGPLATRTFTHLSSLSSVHPRHARADRPRGRRGRRPGSRLARRSPPHAVPTQPGRLTAAGLGAILAPRTGPGRNEWWPEGAWRAHAPRLTARRCRERAWYHWRPEVWRVE
jgi:hypothetical protein